MAHRAPRVFTIPSGAPFLPTLSRALLDGVLIEGFPGAGGPMALADATIYVPTQRAAQALAKALLSASGARSLLLPRIAPLGAFEPDETATIFDPEGEELPRAAVPPAVGALTRRHTLATLTRAWGKALRGAIRHVDADGRLIVDAAEPALVAATPAQAYALAGDLAALIDDMIIEGAPWTRLETLAPDLYDPYWRITLDFLKIAFARWPEWLAERGLIDRAKRIALLIEDEIKALEGARRGPTIIAGSTGANRATARLIAAIARAPKGAVVLPDLDLNLDDRTWAMIGGKDDGSQGLAGHSQALLHQLIGAIGVKPRRCHDSRRALARACGALSLPERGAPSRRVDRSLARTRMDFVAAGPRRRASRRRNHRRRQRERRGAGAGDCDARNARDAGQDRRAGHARPLDRAPRLSRTCPMGGGGRRFGRTYIGTEPGGRAGQAHP